MKVTQIKIEDPLFTVVADDQTDYIKVHQTIFMTKYAFDTAISVQNSTTVDALKRLVLSLIHISEPTRPCGTSRMPSSA